MIEAFWRQLQHAWLFLNTLDSTAAVRRLVAFYVAEHNERSVMRMSGQVFDELLCCRHSGVQGQRVTLRSDSNSLLDSPRS